MQERPLPELLCPAIRVPEIEPCDPAELEPLLAWLRADTPASEVTVFPRGTAMPDGRLDLCKQSLGLANATRLFGALRGNHRVRNLLLGTDGLRDAGAEAAARMLADPEGPTLDTLYLGCNHIEPKGVSALAEAIVQHPVRALWLKRNPVGSEGARALADMLRRQPALEVLDLTNTQLGDEGVGILADALIEQASAEQGASGPKGLQVLLLGGNGVGPAGAERLAEVLAVHPHLRELGLAVSRLGDAGARALAGGIADNRGLQALDLASNGIGPDGLAALLEGLRGQARVHSLDLGSTPSTAALGERDNELLDARGGELLGDFLRANPPLAKLDLRHAGIRSRGALQIRAGLEQSEHLFELKLGKFVARKIKRTIREMLDTNRQRAPAELLAPPWHVAAILSVYRNKTAGR